MSHIEQAGGSASPTIGDIRRLLADTLSAPVPSCHGRAAAVAAVVRRSREDGRVEMLFIRRAKRRGDPWSGHMAWPGGKLEPSDGGPLPCAIRETREELGLDLAADGELIGRLRPWVRGGTSPRGLGAIHPYVFELTVPSEARAGDEVKEAVWIPLDYFTGWSSRRPWRWARRWLPGVPPAYRYEGRLIWGLTQWMLADLLQRLQAGIPAGARPPAGENPAAPASNESNRRTAHPV